MVTMDGKGKHKVESLHGQPCPHTHFWCLSDDYCLPVYLRCNGIDCLEREDETDCDLSDLCPGFYQCRSSSVCLHPSHVCDGVAHCPQRDDEVWCQLACPQQCTCLGLAFMCKQRFSLRSFSHLRYVDARGSGMTLREFVDQVLLIHLSLAYCKLLAIGSAVLNNLNSLDLSYNFLQAFKIEQFKDFPNLKVLFLSGNPSNVVFQRGLSNATYIPLQHLDLSFIELPFLQTSLISHFLHLKLLNLSSCKVNHISTGDFNIFKNLQVLDIKGCELSQFPEKMFSSLTHLHTVYAENFKVCCEAILPQGFNLKGCHAPTDEVSSCEALLHSNAYCAFLSLSAVMALTGNLATFLFRLIPGRKETSGFHVFVINLCIADFLMGVYLSIIGVADRMYLNSYLSEDTRWRHSAACMAAGFLSLVSSQVSVLMICLITLDRFLVLSFPFSQLRFHSRAAYVVSIATWFTCCFLASVPLFPRSPFGEFYNQAGICIPLPITRKAFQGDEFAFAIMIVVNFVIFLLIAVGQGLIYLSIRANVMAASDTGPRQSQDMNIARRLITVAVSDFLCWFPIGMLGLLAKQGVPISGEVNVAMAILVLPINSVINPFLYTLNVIMEQRRKVKEANLLKRLMAS